MSVPEWVFIGSPPTKTCYGIAYAEKRGFTTLEYLRATPARLHAEELAEALREALQKIEDIKKITGLGFPSFHARTAELLAKLDP